MKKFGTVILALYATVVTVVAIYFGVLFFGRENSNKSLTTTDLKTLVGNCYQAITNDPASPNSEISLMANKELQEGTHDYLSGTVEYNGSGPYTNNDNIVFMMELYKMAIEEPELSEETYYESKGTLYGVYQTAHFYFEIDENTANMVVQIE